MRFVRNLVAALVFSLVPPVLFYRLFSGEGPLPVLLVWVAGAAVCLVLSSDIGRKTPKVPVKVVTAIILGMGALVILIQVNVARRSLAEAWLALAREGRAFGFFSFFATEIYSLFHLGVLAFILSQRESSIPRRIVSGFSALVAVNALCAGIIAGNQWFLALAGAGAVCVFLFQGTEKIMWRIEASVFPTLLAGLLALSIAALGGAGISIISVRFWPDFTPIINSIAPTLPLLRDVPGYGYSIGATNMPRSVFLTERTLYRAFGQPNTRYYLRESTFGRWTGNSWEDDLSGSLEIPVQKEREWEGRDRWERENTLSLILAEDFFPLFPLPSDARAIRLYGRETGDFTALENRGIRFAPGAERGLTAEILVGRTEATPAAQTHRGGNDHVDPALSALATELRAKTESDEEYLQAILAHLGTGFTYAQEAGRIPVDADPVSWFLFESRTGFCLYYASAFVLLARSEGIPARLSEGYIVDMDEWGSAEISGLHAHAWPEVWNGTEWIIYEPTPPYAGGRQQRQAEGIQGDEGSDKAVEHTNRRAKALAAAIAVSAFLALLVRTVFVTPDTRLMRRARRLVKQAASRGVPHPGKTGWIAWEKGARSVFAGKKAERAIETARRMILFLYSKR